MPSIITNRSSTLVRSEEGGLRIIKQPIFIKLKKLLIKFINTVYFIYSIIIKIEWVQAQFIQKDLILGSTLKKAQDQPINMQFHPCKVGG